MSTLRSPLPLLAPILVSLFFAQVSALSFPLQRVSLPDTAARQNPFIPTVVQRNGSATFIATLRLPRSVDAQQLVDARLDPPQPPLVTGVTFNEPRRREDGWHISMHVHFKSGVGVSLFAVRVATVDKQVEYAASLMVTVVGVAVQVGDEVVSGRSEVYLGRYDSWLGVRQVALRLHAQGVGDAKLEAGRVSVRLGEDVDSIQFDGRNCEFSDGVAVRVGSLEEAEMDTLFVTGRETFVGGVVRLEEACGVALSEDASWIIVRLEPYRVSGFRFEVRLAWERVGEGGGLETKGEVGLTFRFDEAAVPPPVVMGVQQTLDVYGGEVLEFSLGNAQSPPRKKALRKDDMLLRLSFDEGEAVEVPAETYNIGDSGGAGTEDAVRFVTPALEGRSDLEAQLQYQDGITRMQDAAAYDGSTSVLQSRARRTAVVAPGSAMQLQLASPKLAELDGCSDFGDGFELDRFIIVELGATMYNNATFSKHKKSQIEEQLQRAVTWDLPDGTRLVRVQQKILTFAVPIAANTDDSDVEATISDLQSSVATGTLAEAVYLQEDALIPRNISVVNRELCDAFPDLLLDVASETVVSGLQKRLVPLWVFLGFLILVVASLAAVTFVRFVRHVQDIYGYTTSKTTMSGNPDDVPEPVLICSTDGQPDDGCKGDTEPSEPTSDFGSLEASRRSPPRRGRSPITRAKVTRILDEAELNNPVLNPEYSFRLPRYSARGSGEREVDVDLEVGRSEAMPVRMSDVEWSTDDDSSGVVTRVVDRIANVTWRRRRANEAAVGAQSSSHNGQGSVPTHPQIFVEQVWTCGDDHSI